MHDFLKRVKDSYTQDEFLAIQYAFDFATEAHKGQFRRSGEEYITHPIQVATILLDLGMDADSIIAALLHDVIEDTHYTFEDITLKFGIGIAEMVEAVTKLTSIDVKDVDREKEEQAENIRKLFIAMAKDIRVLIVKLADRLHNMQTMDYLPPERRIVKAQETLDIYAPIAGRLGISGFKSKLEDLSMKYLFPEDYHFLSSKLGEQQYERMKLVERIRDDISQEIDDLGIRYEIKGRPKHLYSVYKKMKRQNKTLEEIYDIVAVRIIVDTIKDCYTILGVIHSKWKPMPGRFKDYIASPKPNMYQSLHTTIITDFGQIFEVQIRTVEMNEIAEYGIAAHWKYKEGRLTGDMTELDKKFSWIREVMDVQSDLKDSTDFLEVLKTNVNATEIYVFTPNGKVVNMPVGSTCIDFAYHIHTEIGNTCVGVYIDNKQAHLNTVLQNGNVVKIECSSASKGPSRDWLNFAVTPTARAKIKSFFKKSMKEENIKLGKETLEREATKKGCKLPDLIKTNALKIIFDKYSFNNIDDMYASIGCGGIRVSQILFRLIDFQKKLEEENKPIVTDFSKPVPKRHASGIIIEGYDEFLINIARCCNPVPNDEIIGYITRGRGVMVHRQNCPNIKNFEKERLIRAAWNQDRISSFQAPIVIESDNDGTIIAKITNIIIKMKLSITSLNTHQTRNRDKMIIHITIEIKKTEDIAEVINKLLTEKSIISVRRANQNA